jgi:hypothetical protein
MSLAYTVLMLLAYTTGACTTLPDMPYLGHWESIRIQVISYNYPRKSHLAYSANV